MAKAHRGRNLRNEIPGSGRGVCPITGQSGVKLLYEYEVDGKKMMISKIARATLANAKRREKKPPDRSG